MLRASWAPAAIALLLAVSTAGVAQAAAAVPATSAKTPAAAKQPANPVTVQRISPHARAARQRALAKADAAPSGIRVSPYTTARKPQKPTAAH
jgi:hypothetical protein